MPIPEAQAPKFSLRTWLAPPGCGGELDVALSQKVAACSHCSSHSFAFKKICKWHKIVYNLYLQRSAHRELVDELGKKNEEKKLSGKMKQRSSWAKLSVPPGNAIDLETMEHELAPKEVVALLVPPLNPTQPTHTQSTEKCAQPTPPPFP